MSFIMSELWSLETEGNNFEVRSRAASENYLYNVLVRVLNQFRRGPFNRQLV